MWVGGGAGAGSYGLLKRGVGKGPLFYILL